MAFGFLPKEDEYFTFFAQMGLEIKNGANALLAMLSSPENEYEARAKGIKDAEHACDELTHKITVKLNKSFITPFDREDIYALTVALDDVLDYIDAAARAVIMYDIREIKEHAINLAKVIQVLSLEIHSAVSMLSKPVSINQHIVEIHRLENEADDIYYRAVGELFRNEPDPITVIKWKELYEILENATDRCESVANIIESIILKHN